MQTVISKEFNFKVQAENVGIRIDTFLVRQLPPGFSRTFLKRLILEGFVLVNNRMIKPHYCLKQADYINVKIPQESKFLIEPQDLPLEVIYEDKDLLVVNKSSGLVTHPAAGNFSHTLVNALLFHCRELSSINELRPGIVHRLDKDTSGVMVVAKNNRVHLDLVRQFQDHSIRRKYIALVSGRVERSLGLIELPIARDIHDRKKMAVRFLRSRPAQTKYEVLKRFSGFSLIELTPATGRTHQLRVHLRFIGHPILGDKIYGKNTKINISRLALHAKTLGFIHPIKKVFMEFSSPLPGEFNKLMEVSPTDSKG